MEIHGWKKGDKKMTEGLILEEIDFEGIVKKACVATKLNNEVETIVKYFNSDECREKEIKEQKYFR